MFEESFRILEQNEERLNFFKFASGQRPVELLGNKVSRSGVWPFNGYVKAIRDLVDPASEDELVRFLGLMNYVSRFADHCHDITPLLYDVLKETSNSEKRGSGKRPIIHVWDKR